MRRPRPELGSTELRTLSAQGVEFHTVPTRELLRMKPEHPVWTGKIAPCEVALEVLEGSIVWVKPPPGIDRTLVSDVVHELKQQGAIVKLLPADRVDVVVTELCPNEPSTKLHVRGVIERLIPEVAKRLQVLEADLKEELEPYLAGEGV